ncbi:MAG: carboxypeptidase regulatory-like domain-containing protein [Hyphomicrobiales bacterium]|nr:carboxypeptidase regulatory-like domain-containing protein [Hyphomicrobiales bacterium]MBV9427175.1 carboxypeptidase regulatory-like domain-containing protein [Bradyrhizobiaceae bacterium]
MSRARLVAAVVFALLSAGASYGQAQDLPALDLGARDIGGIVTGNAGPEAGVWVIAETKNLGTRFAKIVVTDDQGRFVIPDLPAAHYQVWVRGYGLIDSPKADADPGKRLTLQADAAPDRAAAAQYYPANYWFSLLRIPERDKFPGSGPNGNGIPREFKTREQWLNAIKTNGCGNCHQIGNYATRTIPPTFEHLESSLAAWARRLQSGPGGTTMVRTMGRLLTPDGGHLAALADWTDRIAAGELPRSSPSRPTGIERNLVVTIRDWLDPKHYLHDLTATDKRHPTVNANGPVYGATELSTNTMPVLDPVRDEKHVVAMPVRDPARTPSSALANPVFAASPYFGMEQVWDSRVNAHSPAMDRQGRIYFTAQNRPPNDIPPYCKKDSPLRSAQLYPLTQQHDGFFQNARQVTVYDPRSNKFTFIDTCFGTQHLNFAEDENDTLWFSGNTQGKSALVGWVNTKKFWQTGDAAVAQGWSALVVDTNGNGKRDEDYN